MRVLLGMSGGVDSSVAAALLRDAGHEVVGAFLHLWSEEGVPDARDNACCSVEAMELARRVAAALGITLHVLNVRERFKAEIVDPWLEAALDGQTPNPCLACNRRIKVGHLLRRADELGCDAVATGHYARVRRSDGGDWQLLRGVDAAKDQSYFLARLEEAQLARLLLPLGELRKVDVVARARALALPQVADRSESQDLSFVSDDVPSFLRRQAGDRLVPGPVRDVDGRSYSVPHAGLALYTIGQRRGLPVSGTGAPRYVVRREAATNTLVLGRSDDLLQARCTLHDLVLRGPQLPGARSCQAQVRSRASAAPATAEVTGDRARLTFDAPQRAITPGQHAVLYDGQVCWGAGVIARDDIE